ncbi:hypothetical protein T459_17048 [Capsicum annuum]|uniref:Uncharacterized protein n=1 Tax=Capsicum annuum TaxID=4072 RepID=A0A2G2ZAF9_CAPAN|nr:hypothetical protein FXO37_04971 [Capsicum annuum]PHT78996.1 hypothetical protein T459_17048 [Capsicum annuum]
MDKNFVFEIGMKFDSEEESYNAYNLYAVVKDFGVRKGPKTKNRNNEITRCLFLCSYEGQSDKLSPFQEMKRQRLEYRCGCLARIKFKISNDMWKVCEFNDVHSHPMIEGNLRHFIQSGRKLTSATKNILGSMVEAGIRTKKAIRYLQKEAGGIKNTEFIEQDAHNFIQAHKRNIISGGDAQALINHFMHLQSEDSNFFYSFQVDEDGRFCNFFWRDSISRMHYECFGDVIIFDTTYRTNKYNMICATFVGVNNHWKNIFFGCAFLCDETTSYFTWLFQAFLKGMGEKTPTTIFTDQAPTIAAVVREVFPETCHQLCEWYIDRNAQKIYPIFTGNKDFKTTSILSYGDASQNQNLK